MVGNRVAARLGRQKQDVGGGRGWPEGTDLPAVAPCASKLLMAWVRLGAVEIMERQSEGKFGRFWN